MFTVFVHNPNQLGGTVPGTAGGTIGPWAGVTLPGGWTPISGGATGTVQGGVPARSRVKYVATFISQLGFWAGVIAVPLTAYQIAKREAIRSSMAAVKREFGSVFNSISGQVSQGGGAIEVNFVTRGSWASEAAVKAEARRLIQKATGYTIEEDFLAVTEIAGAATGATINNAPSQVKQDRQDTVAAVLNTDFFGNLATSIGVTTPIAIGGTILLALLILRR